MKLPRFAVVGCGRMGRERARHIAAAGGVLAALADVDRERAGALASEHPGVSVSTRAEDLRWDEIAGIFVCTPPAMHSEAIESAAAHGVAVFVEKPLGIDAPQAGALARLAERSGIVNAVGYMNRSRESVALAREILTDARPVAFSAHWAGTPYRVPWWGDPQISGGAFNEQATHLVDLLRFLGGEIECVSAIDAGTNNSTGATLRFESGAVATLLHTCESREKEIAVTAITAHGVIVLKNWDFQISENTIDGRRAENNDPFAAEVRSFVAAATKAGAAGVASDFADAWKTQQVVDRVRESALRARGGALV